MLDVDGPVGGFEVVPRRHSRTPQPRRRGPSRGSTCRPIRRSRRDFAFVVDRDKDAASLLRAAAGADKKLISGVNVFDVFEGASLGEGKKSVAIEVTIQPTDKTLTDEDIEAVSKRIVENVAEIDRRGAEGVVLCYLRRLEQKSYYG